MDMQPTPLPTFERYSGTPTSHACSKRVPIIDNIFDTWYVATQLFGLASKVELRPYRGL